MKTVLITGSRNIIALDFAKSLIQHGYTVYVADTWRHPMVKNNHGISGYFQLPSPRFKLQEYYHQLVENCKQYAIDIIIPMCEEAFYLSALKEKLSKYAEVFTPSYTLMSKLHNKQAIMALADSCGISLPKTWPLHSLADFPDSNAESYILKPVFSRFGHHVIAADKAVTFVEKLIASQNYLVQEKITGQEYCTYALCRDGDVLCQIVYLPQYRLPNSASMYFTSVSHPQIEQFVKRFAKKNTITGQLAFDIIDDRKNIYLIECNPRGSSGIHLLSEVDFGGLLFNKSPRPHPKDNSTSRHVMLGYAMILTMLPRMLIKGKLHEWTQSMSKAKNVLREAGYKLLSPYAIATITEMLLIMAKGKQGFRAASTNDIEWNGEEINIKW